MSVGQCGMNVEVGVGLHHRAGGGTLSVRGGDCPRAHLSLSPDAAGIRSWREPPPTAARGSLASPEGGNPTPAHGLALVARRPGGLRPPQQLSRSTRSPEPLCGDLPTPPPEWRLPGALGRGSRATSAVLALLGSLAFKRRRGGSTGSALACVLTGPSEGSPCPSTASATAVAAILASPCHRRARARPGGGARTLPRPEGPNPPCRPSPFGLKGWGATALSRHSDRGVGSTLDLAGVHPPTDHSTLEGARVWSGSALARRGLRRAAAPLDVVSRDIRRRHTEIRRLARA